MKDLKLNEDYDLDVSGNDFNIIAEGAEVAQSCSIRFLFIQTEWLYDFTIGVDWYGLLFNVKVSNDIKRIILFDIVKNTPGFNSMIEFKFSIDYVNKGAIVEFIANSIYGDVINFKRGLAI